MVRQWICVVRQICFCFYFFSFFTFSNLKYCIVNIRSNNGIEIQYIINYISVLINSIITIGTVAPWKDRQADLCTPSFRQHTKGDIQGE